jgi:hypothetical protein
MLLTQFNDPDFSLQFPDGTWTNHSRKETYEFRCGEQEQILVVRHAALKTLTQAELQKGVIELFHVQMEAAQGLSGNSVRFDAPNCTESPGKFDVFLFGQDLRQGFFMQFGFFGTFRKIIVVSYYDYTRPPKLENFKNKADSLLSSVRVT